jgi:hypothetical protein
VTKLKLYTFGFEYKFDGSKRFGVVEATGKTMRTALGLARAKVDEERGRAAAESVRVVKVSCYEPSVINYEDDYSQSIVCAVCGSNMSRNRLCEECLEMAVLTAMRDFGKPEIFLMQDGTKIVDVSKPGARPLVKKPIRKKPSKRRKK